MSAFRTWAEKQDWLVPSTDEWDTAERAWNAAMDAATMECASRITPGPTSDPMVAGSNVACGMCRDAILALKEKA